MFRLFIQKKISFIQNNIYGIENILWREQTQIKKNQSNKKIIYPVCLPAFP